MLIIVIASTLLSAASLTNGDQWGDFAGYFIQAKGLMAGDPGGAVSAVQQLNADSGIPPGPDAYPWGYPALIAIVARFRGFDPLSIKAINPVFYAAFLLALAIFARKHLPVGLALLVTAAFAFSPISLSLVDHTRSDVVFMAFFMSALAAAGREGVEWKIVLWASIFAAVVTRTLGVTLLVLPLVSYYERGEKWKIEKTDRALIGLFLLLLAFYYLIIPNGEGAYFSHFDLFNPNTLVHNIALTLITPKMFVSHLPWHWVFYAAFAGGLLMGLTQNWREEKPLIALMFSYLAIITIWPEPQDYRFFAPIMPLLVVLSVKGMVGVEFRQPLPTVVAVVYLSILVLFSLPILVGTATRTLENGRAISGPFDQRSVNLYGYIQKNTGPEARIHFAKPRALLFFTDRAAFRAEDCAGLRAADLALYTDDLIGKGGIAEEEMLACEGISAGLIYEKGRYRLYRLR